MLMSFSSEACKCSNYDNSFLYLLEANHVFLATVKSVAECGDENTYEHELYIETNYKGELPEITKVATDCVTSCAFNLKEGHRAIFFTNLNNNTISFCDLQIAFSDSSFVSIKEYLDLMKYTTLNYLEFYEKRNKTGFKAKVTVQDGNVNGVVNIYNPNGKLVVKGLMKEGKMQGYYELLFFKPEGIERWTGNYKDGLRTGEWVYKFTPKDKNKKKTFILYSYQNGTIIKEANLSVEAQLEDNAPKKKAVKKN